MTTLICLVAAGPAAAGEIQLSPSLQGAGEIEIVGDGFSFVLCGTPEPFNIVVTCQTQTFGNPAATSTVSLNPYADDAPPGHWDFSEWVDCPNVRPNNACEITADGTDVAVVAPKAVFTDSTPPTISSVTLKRLPTADGRSVGFTFVADEYVYYECQLNGGEITSCPNGIQYFDLMPGDHTLTTWASDPSGNKSNPITTSFTIDGPPPAPQAAPAAATPIKLLIPRVLGPSSVKARVSRRQVFRLGAVRTTCPAVRIRCRVLVTLKGRIGKRTGVVARKSFRLRPSSSSALKLKLTPKAALALKARRRIKAAAAITVTAPDAATHKSVSVTLRPAVRRP